MRADLLSLCPPPEHVPEVVARLIAAEHLDPPVPRPVLDPLDGVLRVILSQQNTNAVAQRQWEALTFTYPRWEAALLDGPEGIEATLKAAGGGLARVKAAYLHGILAHLEETRGELSLRFLRDLPDDEARAALEALPGVGLKTASLVLLFDLIRPALPVDGNIERTLKRLEFVPPNWSAERTERWFDRVVPREWALRAALHVAGVRHGRHTCLPRNPRCPACPLLDLCPSAPLLSPEAAAGTPGRPVCSGG